MPRFYPNSQFSDCWSSVGNVTYYHRNGICYFRSKVKNATNKQTTQTQITETIIEKEVNILKWWQKGLMWVGGLCILLFVGRISIKI